ncbi:MAG: PAS domain S-box protein [Steroidobacteraceae bacterium]
MSSGSDASHYARWIRQVAWATGLIMTCAFVMAKFSATPSRQVFFDNLQWTVANLGSALLAWFGYRWQRDADRVTRLWFVWGFAFYFLGQLLWDVQAWLGWTVVPAPSDLLYVLCGPSLAIGFWLSLRRRVSAERLRFLALDVAILLIGVLAIVLMVYIDNTVDISALQLAQLAVYPIVMFGSAIIGLLVALVLGLRADWRWQLLPAGLVLTGLAWMRWNSIDLSAEPASGSWLNFSFAAAALMRGLGAAYWRVDADPDSRSSAQSADRYAAFFMLMPLVLVIAAVATVFFAWDASHLPRLLQVAVLIGAAMVIVLAVIRQILFLAERERLLRIERGIVEKERQHRATAQRLELATAAARSGIWEIDLLSDESIWDARMYALFGFDPETPVSCRTLWRQSVHPDDQSVAVLARQRAIAEGTDCNFEFRIIRPDGELRYLDSYGAVQYDGEGRAISVTGVTRDITERVLARRALSESEAELSAIFENSVLGVVLIDQQRHILRSNRAVRALMGYSVAQAAQIKVEDILHPDDREQSLQMFNALLSGELGDYQIERRYRHHNGDYLWVRATVYPVVLKDLRNFVCLIEDISQRKHAEAQLQEVQRNELRMHQEFAFQLLNAQERERQRIANELHDSLGQSLSVIKNRAQLALEQVSSGTPIASELQGISRVTTDAIAEVRGLAHNLRPLHLEQLGLTAALGQLVEQFAQANRLQVETRLEPIDDVFPPQQITHIYRLLQEGLNNIGKHAQATRVRIGIERDVSAVRITIIDNGCGFDAGAALQSGGIGLHSMTERAGMLGGRMHIDSGVSGTAVLIELPIIDEPALVVSND